MYAGSSDQKVNVRDTLAYLGIIYHSVHNSCQSKNQEYYTQEIDLPPSMSCEFLPSFDIRND